MVALASIFNFKMKITLERHHVTKTKHKESYVFHEVYAVNRALLRRSTDPPTHFSHVILLSNANSQIPRETILNFGSIEFYVPENP